MSYFDYLRERLVWIRAECKRLGWADYIYQPYCPLVVMNLSGSEKR